MFRWIVGTSLKFRYIVLALAVGLVFFGVRQLNEMPVDVFPEFAPPMVEVQTISLGLSPEEVESLVTVPMEQVFSGIPGVSVIRSKSVPDLSAIKIYFETGTDLMLARQLVAERVATITPTIPTWAAPPIILPPLSATSRMMKIGISSQERSVIDLSMITYWTIRQRLLRVPGVANVAIWGERIEMFQVNVIPELMREHEITLDEVMEVTSGALDVGLFKFADGHYVGSGGWVDTPEQRLQVRHVLPLVAQYDDVTADELADMPVAVRNGQQIYLKDIARVEIGHQPMIGDGVVNDDIGLLLIVEKFPWGNTLQVSRDVEEAIAALRPGLPADIAIDTEIFRPATFIETSINNLNTALLIAALLVIIVLFAFLYEWRTALISCTAIPLSLLTALLVIYWRGEIINTMILAGLVIALGAVVDDAIVDVENIVRRLREARKTGEKVSVVRTILEASMEVRHAIIFSTLIEVAALVPVFLMEGLSGAFFKPLAFSYSIAIVASTLVALTVTPAMSYLLLRNAPLEKRESPLTRWLHRGYNAVLARIVDKPRSAYVTVGVIAVMGLAIAPRLGQSLLPDFKERDFLMHWLTKPGTSWPEMQRITIQGCRELQTIPGVRNCGAHIGQALVMDEVVGMYFAENWISVDPSVDYDETLAKVQATVDGYPGLYRDVQTYLKERIREVLTGTSDAIVVRIFGQDLHTLEEKATEVVDALGTIPGVVDQHTSFQEHIPQIEVEVDIPRARSYGLKPGDIRRAATTIVAGEEAGDIHIGNRTYDVNVWSVPEARNSLSDLRTLQIDVPSGGYVQLQQVADVSVKPTPNVINREHLKRRIDVTANVSGRDLGSVYADVEAALAQIDFPQEYYPVLLGEYTERQAVQRRIMLFAIISALAIFLLLATSFKSIRLAIISFVLLPAALVGGVLAAWMGDGVISLGSMVGFLTVLGISARNGILMINHFQHLEEFEGESFGVDMVLRGARERLAPILMTATTTGLALIPLVIAGSIPGNEIEHPMAIVILGGLITSTLLNLFVVPSLYLRFAQPVAQISRVEL